MQAKNFSISKLLKPLPLFILFVLLMLIVDWIYPEFLSRFSFFIILIGAVLSGFLPKKFNSKAAKIIKSEKEKKSGTTTQLETIPQISKFKTFFNFQDLINNVVEETTIFIEKLPPSSISIFANLSSKNQRYPVYLGSLIQQIRDFTLPLFLCPILSMPQKKLSFYKLNIFLAIPEKKSSIEFKKLDIKASPEHKAYIELVILLCIFQRLEKSSHKLKSTPFFCDLQSNLFEYPDILQTLKDVINHPDFPKHLIVFMVSATMLSEHGAFLESLQQQGFQIGIHADKLPAPALPSFLQVFYIDLSDLKTSLKGLARRQFSHTIQTLTEQPYKVVLGKVDDEQILQDILPAQFDFACGPTLSEIKLWQDVLTTKK